MSEKFAADGNSESSFEPGNSTTDRVAEMAHDGVDQVAKAANQAEHGVRRAVEKTSEAAQHTQDQAATAASESLAGLRLFVEENPVTTVGIAIAAGFLLSVLIRR